MTRSTFFFYYAGLHNLNIAYKYTIQKVVGTTAGEVSFEALTFEKAGTYLYGVEEVKGKATGYTYDKNKYAVEITVEDVDGALVATGVNYLVDGKNDPAEAEAIVFVNKYTAPAGNPQTGDDSTMGLFMALATVSMMGVAVIFWNRKKIFG